MKIDPLDVLFSEYIRMRAILRTGGCERCLHPKFDKVKENGEIFPAWKQLQCSHYHPRTKKSTRWDEEDCVGLCGGCHTFLEHNPLEHTNWFREQLGEEAFDLLYARARTLAKYVDKVALKLYYENKIKEILDEQGKTIR